MNRKTIESSLPPHVELLSPVSQISFPDSWYAFNTPRHFWFKWRLIVLLKSLVRMHPRARHIHKVLDVGSGTGELSKSLREATDWRIDICDLNLNALSRCTYLGGRIMYYDLYEKNSGLFEEYDAAILFDILEHIADAESFLRCALWHIKRGGYLFINVPALMIFYSNYDRAAGHLRRYDKGSLLSIAGNLDTDIQDIRYWGFSMVPLLLFRKWMVAWKKKPADIIERGFLPPGKWFNLIFKLFMRCETAFLSNPPVGSSMMMILKKR